jgi:ANTAR domain-containing protein/GAF domain-containing protein
MTFDFSPLNLAMLYAGIGRELALQRSPHGVFGALAELAVQEVPGARYASITEGQPGRFKTVAATDELAVSVDRIQYELGSGPCVDAIVQNTVFNAIDLRNDARWPDFGTRAAETAGIASMLSLRLFLDDGDMITAGLNLYSDQVAAFDETAEALGLLLATHGALAAQAAAARDKAENLVIALSTNRQIGVAMGILMQQHRLTEDQAFDLLRIASQHGHRKLSAIAADVVQTGALNLPENASALIDSQSVRRSG